MGGEVTMLTTESTMTATNDTCVDDEEGALTRQTRR